MDAGNFTEAEKVSIFYSNLHLLPFFFSCTFFVLGVL